MTDFAHIGLIWLGTVGVTYIAWFVVHFNGKIICGLAGFIYSLAKNNNRTNLEHKSWLTVATQVEIILLGVMQLRDRFFG